MLIDYAYTGMDISQARVDQANMYPDKISRPEYIIWNGEHVQTFDWWDVPTSGIIKIEFISAIDDIQQGVDVKIDAGAIRLETGEEAPVLRTWYDDRYEDTVEYPFHTSSDRLCIWNVYKLQHPSGRVTEEKWTGNSGFVVEQLNVGTRLYRCSPGGLSRPTFEGLVVKIRVTAS